MMTWGLGLLRSCGKGSIGVGAVAGFRDLLGLTVSCVWGITWQGKLVEGAGNGFRWVRLELEKLTWVVGGDMAHQQQFLGSLGSVGL